MTGSPTTFRCASCGEDHDLLQLSFGAEAPLHWELLTDAQRARSQLGGEQAILEDDEGTHRYLRACLELPIAGTDRVFTWGVWCSLSEASFDEVSERWDDPERVALGPCFGWLATRLPGYPETLHLKTMVHQRPPGERPWVELEPTGHPLAVQQREGVTVDELGALLAQLLHADG